MSGLHIEQSDSHRTVSLACFGGHPFAGVLLSVTIIIKEIIKGPHKRKCKKKNICTDKGKGMIWKVMLQALKTK